MDEKFFPNTLDDYRIETRTTKPILAPKIAFVGHTERNPFNLLDGYQVMHVPCLEHDIILKRISIDPNKTRERASAWDELSILSMLISLLLTIAFPCLITSVLVSNKTISVIYMSICLILALFSFYARLKYLDLDRYPSASEEQPRDLSRDYIVATTENVEKDLNLYKEFRLSDEIAKLPDRFTKAYIHYLKLRLQKEDSRFSSPSYLLETPRTVNSQKVSAT